MDEVELKFFDIDINKIKLQLNRLGAKYVYDSIIESVPLLANGFSSFDSNKKYLRLRKINDKVFLTYKSPAKDSCMQVTEEVEIEVDDFETTLIIFEKLGFKRGSLFKKHRVHFELNDNIHFELDTIDSIPTYLEIETGTEKEMFDVCKKLRLNISEGKKGTIVEIFPELFK